MGNYNHPITQSRLEVKLLETKSNCSHTECGHSAYKCFKCRKWKDNLENELVAENEILKVLLAFYMPYYIYIDLMEGGIVETWIRDKKNRTKRPMV